LGGERLTEYDPSVPAHEDESGDKYGKVGARDGGERIDVLQGMTCEGEKGSWNVDCE
jgi:hypothetical protein